MQTKRVVAAWWVRGVDLPLRLAGRRRLRSPDVPRWAARAELIQDSEKQQGDADRKHEKISSTKPSSAQVVASLKQRPVATPFDRPIDRRGEAEPEDREAKRGWESNSNGSHFRLSRPLNVLPKCAGGKLTEAARRDQVFTARAVDQSNREHGDGPNRDNFGPRKAPCLPAVGLERGEYLG